MGIEISCDESVWCVEEWVKAVFYVLIFSLMVRVCCVFLGDVEVVDVQLFVLGEMYFKRLIFYWCLGAVWVGG